ncbi:MAG TPA: hypothetical protein VFO05_00380 [Candidatus Limnocylindrales bacterium]|nr:hypothetical protein [Candidatus Limnocylindrales bacterium]
MQDSEQALNDGRLVPVMESRAGGRVEADAQVGAEDFADRREDSKARLDRAGLDPGEVTVIDPGCQRQRSQREASVQPKAADVLSQTPSQLCRGPTHGGPSVGASQSRWRGVDSHGVAFNQQAITCGSPGQLAHGRCP